MVFPRIPPGRLAVAGRRPGFIAIVTRRGVLPELLRVAAPIRFSRSLAHFCSPRKIRCFRGCSSGVCLFLTDYGTEGYRFESCWAYLMESR